MNKVEFNYYKPFLEKEAPFLGFGIIIAIIVMVNNLYTGGVVLLVTIILSYAHIIYASKLKNVKGCFAIKDDGFDFITQGKTDYIPFEEITDVVKECYKKDVNLIVASGTTLNPGQYRLMFKRRKPLILRISEKEEKDYSAALNRTARKVYKTNALGVHLTKNVVVDEMEAMQRDAQFEAEKPVFTYTLTNAINILVEKGFLNFEDCTK